MGEIYDIRNQNEINLKTPCPTNLFSFENFPPTDSNFIAPL